MSKRVKDPDRLTPGKVFINGLVKENPTFVLMLGMCPTLAVTSSAINGLGMGLTTTVVLTMSNILISALRKVIPDKVRIPAFIVIIASFVTIVGQFLEAYLPALNDALGMFIPLIVVNCIILGRAEAFASKNNVLLSAFDGLGMGLGFSVALTMIGLVREMIGAHKVFGFTFVELMEKMHLPQGCIDFMGNQTPIAIFVMAPGAFFVLATLVAILNHNKEKKRLRGEAVKEFAGCGHDCLNCHDSSCSFYDPNGSDEAVGLKGKKKKKKKDSDDLEKVEIEMVSVSENVTGDSSDAGENATKEPVEEKEGGQEA
ncbi:MAG: electron transport complex subunit E [Lachnospiraceae bacterium]|nr:electron transport complex subunit E [Lachnospiraceae bacterium]